VWHFTSSSEEPVERRSQRHRVNEDGVLAVDIEDADLQQRSVAAGPISIVNSSSMTTRSIAVRTACNVSSSPMSCLRAGAPIRT
jgi:hypothetical protein